MQAMSSAARRIISRFLLSHLLFSKEKDTMLYKSRCRCKLHRSIVILICVSLVFLINYVRDTGYPLASNLTQSIKPLNRSLLLHINGRIKQLGQAYPIYIINLPSRIDRRTESIALMQTIDLEAFLVPAYPVRSPEILPSNRNRNNLFFTSTELACWTSHMRVWITIAHNTSGCNDDRWSIIFEDDIDLEMDTVHIMQSLPSSIWAEADLIYLGHCANPPGKLIYQFPTHNYRVHQALHPSCTHAYAIRSRTARILMSSLSSPSQPIDNAIVQLAKQLHLVVYSIHPPLVIQKPVSMSNPSDVNLIDRQSWMYRIQLLIYTFIQWWNGVELSEKLNQSAFERTNLISATEWRRTYETGIWKQIFQ